MPDPFESEEVEGLPALHEDDIEVPVDPDPPADEDKDEEERPSRKERRSERYQEQYDRAAAAEAERDRLRGENEQIRATMLQQMQASAQPAAPRQPDPLDEAYREQERLWEVYNAKLQAGSLSADEQRQYLQENRRLADRYADLRIQRGVHEGIREYENSRPQPTKLKQELDALYPDVLTNDRARAYMQGVFQSRQAAENVGTDETSQRALLAEVMDETRQRFKLGPHAARANDHRARARHTGVGTASGDGGRPRTITMTRDLKVMADSLYPDLPEKERYRKWAQEVGSKMLKKEGE